MNYESHDPDDGTPDLDDPTKTWQLRLYVAGQSPKCIRALANLKRFCEEHLTGRYTIEVVDLLVNPQLAEGDQILAVPTLVRKLPPPMKKMIGDLSSEEKMLVGLDLRTRDGKPAIDGSRASLGPRRHG